MCCPGRKGRTFHARNTSRLVIRPTSSSFCLGKVEREAPQIEQRRRSKKNQEAHGLGARCLQLSRMRRVLLLVDDVRLVLRRVAHHHQPRQHRSGKGDL